MVAFAIVVVPAVAGTDDWPQWRGPLGTGVASGGDPPVEWSEDRNIRWKRPVPGTGHSTPIVWGDRVFITSAVPYGDPLPPRHDDAHGSHDSAPITHRYRFVVFAISRENGDIQWERTVQRAVPHEGGHYTGSLASNSPVTDGELLFAFFGSRGLYCLSLDGDPRWDVDLGDKSTLHAHGEGSSPALHGDTVVVNWDHEGQSFVVAFDKRTGDERWRTVRDEVTSWATPIVVEHEGRSQVIVSGTNRVRSYDMATGDVIWECGGLSRNVVASPVAANGIVYAASSYDTRAMLAIRLDGAAGDITGTDQVVWTRTRHTPYVPSLLLYEDTLYFLRHYQAILSRVRADTGDDITGPLRLGGIRNVYASPVAASDRVYITDLSGATLVLSHAEEPQILALNHLDDEFSASAAISGGDLFLRGRRYLYCIATQP
ncbi:PQQ-like beta-propeller repeat protein [Candidatus Poribacteria bacterium]|nr:PQQ-like beta-propeller repeat protein [Candidatus Poribacteria bacterium]MBT5534930.1 PQQ-like beta-propeller repeat protein [Candidatus Poribacteria bacterium]MBT5711415.1 PQQ-like beta-propeller repeat protein [Candidatus Poribacteria bacterium]MBT7808880.1 PQQ-like beta-propeller repeat protein [Candidatus Poribacteria bacterium]